jgi:SAM-dependent methyltransferase
VSRAEGLSRLVREVQDTEGKYLLHGDRNDPERTPWMPYQPADFIGMLWECLPEIAYSKGRPPSFLDVGCGPGTKMKIAQDLFGFDAAGIESDETMAAEAQREFGHHAICADALSYSFYYGWFDVIWLYRPLRDSELETRLEASIVANMKPGAILAGGSWETDIPGLGWATIVDDCLTAPDGSAQIWRGAWKKPGIN